MDDPQGLRAAPSLTVAQRFFLTMLPDAPAARRERIVRMVRYLERCALDAAIAGLQQDPFYRALQDELALASRMEMLRCPSPD